MAKIIKTEDLDKKIQFLKQNDEKIVLTGGSFDVVHVGHIEFLKKSKNLGGKLIILLESDESIKKAKGSNRPLHSQTDRARVLSHLDMVDYIVTLPFLESDEDYEMLVKTIKPDIISVVKSDPRMQNKLKQAEKVGAKVIEVMEEIEKHSSSNILKKLTQ